MKLGDKVIGYDFRDQKAVVCLLEVVSPVAIVDSRKIIEIRVVKIIDPKISVEHFAHETPFAGSLGPVMRDRLFALTPQLYSLILGIDPKILVIDAAFKRLLASYRPEGTHQQPDKLGFQNDVDAIGAVIAQRSVHPPLAVGLFGNWGAGKSFFMKKLADAVEAYSKSKNELFVEHVVPVAFNSWHYVDSNLWASLITHIFEQLNVKAKALATGIEQLNVIYKKLDLISGQVIETEKKLTDKREQITSIQLKVQTLEEEIINQKDNLTMWNKRDLVMIVSKVPAIQDKLEQIKKEFQDVETVENIQQINDRIREFNTFINRLTRSFRILWQNSKGKWLALWFFFALFIFAIYMVTAGPWKDLLSTAHRIWSGVVTFCALVVSNLYFLKPVYNKVADFYEGLKELKTTVDQEKAKVELKEEHEVKKLSQQINELTGQKITLETHLATTMDEKARLETQLSDLGSGKALANFISEKSTDDEYTKQLGILSWIRKDFQKLNDLFEQQRERSLKRKSEGKLTDPPVLEIDRIVLYIDDLDRCNAETVVKVLEAINLLLAFPLFVVIVGVDPRWLKNALNNKLGELFGDGSKDSPSDATSEELATSYDYLEKIFQIPFAIKPIDDAGGKALISQLLEGDISRPVITPVTNRNLQQAQEDSGKSDLAPMPLLPTDELHNTIEAMRMTEEEMSFMQQLSPLFARSPRHVNRYVNIYRIIKSHRDLRIIAPTALDEYQIILFLLAVLVGFNSAATDFFNAILTGKGRQPIKDLLVLLKNDPYKTIGKLAAKIDAALPLASFPLFLKMLQEFRTNMDLISRFSFRMIELQEVTPENPET